MWPIIWLLEWLCCTEYSILYVTKLGVDLSDSQKALPTVPRVSCNEPMKREYYEPPDPHSASLSLIPPVALLTRSIRSTYASFLTQIVVVWKTKR